MKPEELMIGDWVKYGNHKKVFFLKVTTISRNWVSAETKEGFGLTFSLIDEMYKIDLSDLEPIELTDEILTKNNFVFTDPWYERKGIPIQIKKEKNFKWLASKTGSVNLHFKYVHELQHLMKLCNINQEITI